MLKLDYVSCILTIISTVLIGKKLWQGWVIAGANSIIICVIGMRSAQFGFVPANLFCHRSLREQSMELATENPGVSYPANVNWFTHGQ